jgi:hypothetical protein
LRLRDGSPRDDGPQEYQRRRGENCMVFHGACRIVRYVRASITGRHGCGRPCPSSAALRPHAEDVGHDPHPGLPHRHARAVFLRGGRTKDGRRMVLAPKAGAWLSLHQTRPPAPGRSHPPTASFRAQRAVRLQTQVPVSPDGNSRTGQ